MKSSCTSTHFQTSSGASIRRLPLEAFPNFWVYAYLVQVNQWNVLIDTGSGSENSNVGLENGLAEAGLNPADLTHILLTHGHIDHYGGLNYLHERTNAQIGVHELDLETITNHEARLALLSRKLDTFLSKAGIPIERRAELLTMYSFTKALYRSVQVDFTYVAQDMLVGPFELLHVPGHCPGHVVIKLDDIIFCGDLILEKVTPHQAPEELTPFMGVHHYLESLSVFEHWTKGASLILNGHDDPVADLKERITAIRINISHRLEQTLDAVSEPCTLGQITKQVYGEMDGYNALLVIEKIGAYVEYLVQRGLLEIVNIKELEENSHTPIKYGRVKRPGLSNGSIMTFHNSVAMNGQS